MKNLVQRSYRTKGLYAEAKSDTGSKVGRRKDQRVVLDKSWIKQSVSKGTNNTYNATAMEGWTNRGVAMKWCLRRGSVRAFQM